MLGVVKVSVEFSDYSMQCKGAINDAIIAGLYEAGVLVEGQAKRNTKVVTGKTKDSFQHKVDEGSLACHIGSNYDNAIWEEFGTGIYAVEGNGRKTPWVWVDEKGVRHFTKGKRPKRMLFNAFNTTQSSIKRMLEERMRSIR